MTNMHLTLIPRKPGDSKYYDNILIQGPDGWILGATHIDSFWDHNATNEDGERGGELHRRLREGHQVTLGLSIQETNDERP